ncbi:H-2 class II histocompatibility antigen, E-S beta chain-like [Puntigrus tetrazona]|uniref:H-2 class II histocompatibility antigen, E-S beta chain-like n=1 Tax=Puntigrus tetrazona TaxID=1606681 RepID=UPI001C8967C1|nr:H-2 class II histocompatibility antigen, E-S beta chain-like [Puntigrus tetrazona]XP_043102146.1 H-2 class II histocompatibility antigen, E-S beta chain-like [Puntigrus tetrazona]
MSPPKVLSFHLILMLSAFTGAADGYYHSSWAECIYSSPDLSDMVYIDNYIFNKDIVVQFNSTVGEYVGYTELGVKSARAWNSDGNILQQERAEVERFCKHNAQIRQSAITDKTVAPKVKLSSVKLASGGHPAVLMCSAYRFYPHGIKVTWLKDNTPVKSDVTSTEELPNGDWYYQIHSHLEYTPKSGEKISCMVDHAGLKKPLIVDWDPSLPESERNKIAIGASGLVLGVIIAAAGLIYYKKKSAGRILVPT